MIVDLWTDMRKWGLDSDENILFMLGVLNQDLSPTLLNHVLNFPNANVLGNRYLDQKDGKIFLKEKFKNSNYMSYITALVKYGVSSRGHLTNELEFGIGVNSTEARLEFQRLLIDFPELDVDLLARVTSKYYEKGRMLTKLDRYLRENARMDLLHE